MTHYNAPTDEIRHILHNVLDVTSVMRGWGGEADTLDADTLDAVVEEMGRFVTGEFLPTNAEGDAVGCRYDAEQRQAYGPEVYRAPFQRFVEGGWTALTAPIEHGGQNLPKLLGVVLDELCAATNTSLSMYFGLTHGAVVALEKHASEALRGRYLEPLISGEWTGTMCLTEPQCGTDLGLIRTKAEPAQDAGAEEGIEPFRLNGQKIWITGGDHDYVENIIHLVLAKLPDAPAGTKGISLFLVPKFLRDGSRNGIYCTGLEHKMGINGSATCFMSLEDAEGYLIGEPHQGLKYMFSMMNSARLMVGVQGLGLADAARQTALAFAQERQQGRSINGAAEPDAPADTILVHPDVRRMLLRQASLVAGMRGLAYWTGLQLDISERHPDADSRSRASDQVELLTPIVKAYLTDYGYEVCDSAVQVMGGSGYTRDWGVEQYLRDARIARIYEGTNGIQALDFVGRKLPLRGGEAVRSLMTDLFEQVKALRDEDTSAAMKAALKDAQEVLMWLMQQGMQDREQAVAGATPTLRLFGHVLCGFWLARSADASDESDPVTPWRVALRNYFLTEVLPETSLLRQQICAGKQHLTEAPAQLFQ